MNRGNDLARELSPYLLQHAHNPVDWKAWSSEAFDEAKRRDVPVLVSIGYSACHWCHVMERESFEDPKAAESMNRSLVCIKVDREERPDVDAVYMEYVQRLTGRGGWPLNVFVTPQGIPFYGGTYFPPDHARGGHSWLEVVDAVAAAYREKKEQILSGAGELAQVLATRPAPGRQVPTDLQVRQGIARQIASLDRAWGGFPGAPKFPPHSFLSLCLSLPDLTESETALLRTTLDRIAQGGIRDHVDGGFARYSTDEAWIVPHFEKMLYDNAQLVHVYAQAAARFSEPRYANVASDTISWMRRELGDPAGGFRSALDADSDGREGAYYTWSWKELEMLLGKDANDFAGIWNASPAGNFEGENILWTDDMSHVEGEERSERWRSMLARSRALREKPGLDDKVLTSWNGLALSGLARAGARLGDHMVIEEARRVAIFCRRELRHPQGLWSVWKNGLAKNLATLEDWAFLGEGYLELWQATGELEWLEYAIDAGDQILDRFSQDDSPLLRFSDRSNDDLFVQVSPLHDNATPSGNASAARLLARLWHLTGRIRYKQAAERIVDAAGDSVASFPRAFSALAEARRILSPEVLLVHLSGVFSDPDFATMRDVLQQGAITPDVLVLGARSPIPGLLRDGFCGTHGSAIDPAAWICRGSECLLPIHTAKDLEAYLNSLGGTSKAA